MRESARQKANSNTQRQIERRRWHKETARSDKTLHAHCRRSLAGLLSGDAHRVSTRHSALVQVQNPNLHKTFRRHRRITKFNLSHDIPCSSDYRIQTCTRHSILIRIQNSNLYKTFHQRQNTKFELKNHRIQTYTRHYVLVRLRNSNVQSTEFELTQDIKLWLEYRI